jgi:hypothetical protein
MCFPSGIGRFQGSRSLNHVRNERSQDQSLGRFAAQGLPWRTWVVAATAAAWVWVPAALAQQPVEPPAPEKPIFQWLFALGLTAVCCGIAFKNPRRSHLG